MASKDKDEKDPKHRTVGDDMDTGESVGAVEGYVKLGEQKRHDIEDEVKGLPSDADDKARAAWELAENNRKTEAERAAQSRLGRLPPYVAKTGIEAAIESAGLTLADVKSFVHEGNEISITPWAGPARRIKATAMYEPLIERAIAYAGVRREDLVTKPTVNKADVEMYARGHKGPITIPLSKLQNKKSGGELPKGATGTKGTVNEGDDGAEKKPVDHVPHTTTMTRDSRR